jgi:hypothetical protein
MPTLLVVSALLLQLPPLCVVHTPPTDVHRDLLQRQDGAAAPAGRVLQSTPRTGCLSADVNGDGVVSVPDLLLVLQDFGRSGVAATVSLPTDVNSDGLVAIADLLLVLGSFGRRCRLGPTAVDETASPLFTRPGLTVPPHLVFILADVRSFTALYVVSTARSIVLLQGDQPLPCTVVVRA